jgi:elongation factor G
MPNYTTADIRNISLVGHGGAGKTSLGDAILHATGVTNRLGSVADQTSYLDYTEEEKNRGCSIDSAVMHVQAEGKEINIVVTPGAPDFIGPAIASLAGVETAVCVISAVAGIEVNTRRMMEKTKEFGLGRMIVINKIDAENANPEELVGQVQESFGKACQPFNLPAGGGKSVVDCFTQTDGKPDFGSVVDVHAALVDAVVEADEALMEEYLDKGSVSAEKLAAGVSKAIASGSLVPIFFTNARGEVGVKEFLAAVAQYAPSPITGKRRTLTTAEGETPLDPNPAAPFVAQVVKITGDPKSNIKYSLLRVHSGSIKSDSQIIIGDERRGQRPGALHKLQGAEHPEIDQAIAGDVVAVARLDLKIGNVVHGGTPGEIAMPAFPAPMFAVAIEPKSRGDADKVSGALAKYTEEDPCFIAERDPVTHELVIRGVGDLHLRTILSRMSHQFKLEVDTKPPKIPYRETILGRVSDVEYTHKKQTGGAGQFGRVIIALEPNERGKGYEFIDDIFGGAIDLSFRPSVDKGIQAQMKEGVIAGYPVVDVKVHLTDGKTHPVDSKDIAFQIAGREAFKIAFMQCKPVLLEPIVNMEVTVPQDNVGDITGDLTRRRGRTQGQDMLPGGFTVIKAQVPLAEVSDYHSRLSSITGGRGSYTMELSHYEVVPGNVQQQIIDQAKKAKEEARGH